MNGSARSHRLPGLILLLCSLLLACTIAVAAEGAGRGFRVEHAAGVWQDGYLDGPAQGAMFSGNSLAEDGAGNLFVMDITRVRVITRQGRVWTVAGNGVRGFRDGPADEAMFNIGGRGYEYCNIGVDGTGRIFVPDGHNNRIRMTSRKPDGSWWVQTLAGGGTKRLQPGQKGKSLEIYLKEPVSLAVDARGNVWTQASSCLYKITPDGETFAYQNPAGNVVYMQADGVGNVYLLVRQDWASHYWKVTPDGVAQRMAGLTEAEVNLLKKAKQPLPVDGPALGSTFFAHATFGVSADGAALYGGSGDENVPRRVMDGSTMSLFAEGWRKEENNRRAGLNIGGPALVARDGSLYLVSTNPPRFLKFRRLVPSN